MRPTRHFVAGAFLAVGLGVHILRPGFGGLVGVLLAYCALFLAALAGARIAAVWGGGILLLGGQILALAASPWVVRAMSAGAGRGARLSLSLLTVIQPPASAVFLLPIGLWLGGRIGARLGLTEARPSSVSIPSASARLSERLGAALALVGALLVVATTLLAGNLAAAIMAMWALLPYGLLYMVGRSVANPWVVGGAGAAALTAEVGVRASVFLFPRGSTSGIALAFSPVLISVLFLPVGGAAGWLLSRLWRSDRLVVRAPALLVYGAALALTLIGLARPDLFPTAVLDRRQARERLGEARERLGEARVVTGSEDYERKPISDRSGWLVPGDFDGVPGDEIAIVTHDGAEFLDPVDLQAKGSIDFPEPRGRLWNWFSTLALLDGELVVVQTGGGYSSTELRAIDGRLIWAYRPDPKLPPTAMKPADLDRDGVPEFYASTYEALVRLDATGKEVWSRAARRPYIVGMSPKAEARSGMVVAGEMAQLVKVWDEGGRLHREISLPSDIGPLGVAELTDDLGLLCGGSTIRVLDFHGNTRFQFPLDGMTAQAGLSIRFRLDDEPLLAVVAGAPRDVGRWRMILLKSDGRLAYDEVLDHPIELRKALGVDGVETLLLRGKGLYTLRPRQDDR